MLKPGRGQTLNFGRSGGRERYDVSLKLDGLNLDVTITILLSLHVTTTTG